MCTTLWSSYKQQRTYRYRQQPPYRNFVLAAVDKTRARRGRPGVLYTCPARPHWVSIIWYHPYTANLRKTTLNATPTCQIDPAILTIEQACDGGGRKTRNAHLIYQQQQKHANINFPTFHLSKLQFTLVCWDNAQRALIVTVSCMHASLITKAETGLAAVDRGSGKLAKQIRE